MDNENIVELLNLDLQDEHGAIIQYLGHAYAMGEGEVSCEIEAIARDEMRHLDWLAETIVELGGKPSLVRGTMRTGGESPVDWMKNDVALENDALGNYARHLEMIDNLKIKRLIERIMADEKAHHGKFEHFVGKVKKEGLKDERGERSDATASTLNWGIEHEYTVILQYMFHSYVTKNQEARKQLEDQAINEMQHLGWLAEELVDGGGNPRLEHTEPNQSTELTEALKADIAIEKQVADRYDKASKETDDEGLRELLIRIRDNERYHLEVFHDLLGDSGGK